jgi:hypothetical protein
MRQAIAIFCTLIVPGAATLAQNGPPAPQSTPLLSPDQLDNLVAPIALYPDPLLAQVLAASTYPLEIIEAQQWLNQNRGLSGQALIDAAKRQNWDPSVAALVAFPDALTLLSGDIQWTTDLGNAFLAQQADVMSAIQRMRARAEQNGRLQSTTQQTVTGDPGAIQIQPANPQVVYVPVYNPVYVWGPPDWGAYPALWYPPVSYGCGFGVGVLLGGLFAGFLGFGGWGWGVSWLAHGLFLNGLFFSHFGFGGSYGFAGRTWWAHDPVHRMGVAYPNRALAARYGGTGRPYSGRFSERARRAEISGTTRGRGISAATTRIARRNRVSTREISAMRIGRRNRVSADSLREIIEALLRGRIRAGFPRRIIQPRALPAAGDSAGADIRAEDILAADTPAGDRAGAE